MSADANFQESDTNRLEAPIVVTGATGNVGLHVTRGLLDAGARGRVAAHDPDAARASFIDARDIAAVAVKTLTEPGHENRAYELTGSQALSYAEAAEILTDALGREIRYPNPSPWAFWSRMRTRGHATGTRTCHDCALHRLPPGFGRPRHARDGGALGQGATYIPRVRTRPRLRLGDPHRRRPIGVASLIPYIRDTLANLGPDALPVSLPAAIALALLQNSIITAILTAIDVFAAPRVGFTSRVLQHARGEPQHPWRPEIRAALLTAVLLATVTVLAELAFLALLGDELRVLWQAMPRTLGLTLQGILYGGITEELWMRFGLLSGLVWLVWRAILRRRGPPAPALVWSVIAIVAVLFALGHMPGLAALTDVNTTWVLRSLLLNGAVAVALGYLFVRYSLEAAMLAHATMHIAITLIALVTALP